MWQHRSPAIGRRRSHDPSIPLTPTHRVQDHLLFVPLLHFVLQLVVFLAYAASPRLMSTTAVRQEPSLPLLQGRLPHLQLVSPFGSKLWNLPCSRVFLKSAVVFLFRLSYLLANGLFYLLLDCKVCFKSYHRHRYGTVYNFTRGVWIISKTIYTTRCIPLRVLCAQWYPSTRPSISTKSTTVPVE